MAAVGVWLRVETMEHHQTTHDESVEKKVDVEWLVGPLQSVEPSPGVDVLVVELVHKTGVSVIMESF